jgi:WD40 repeat protein
VDHRHRAHLTSLITSPFAKDMLLTTSHDHSIRVWKLGDGAPVVVHVLLGTDVVVGLACAPSNKGAKPRLAVAWNGSSLERTLIVRSADDGQSDPAESHLCSAPANCVAISPTRTEIVAGHLDNLARVWRPSDTPTMERFRLTEATSWIQAVGYASDGEHVVTADTHWLRLYDLTRTDLVEDMSLVPVWPASKGELEPHGVFGLALGTNGVRGAETVVTISEAGAVQWWSMRPNELQLEPVELVRKGVQEIAIDSISRDARRVALGFDDRIELIDRDADRVTRERLRVRVPLLEKLAWRKPYLGAVCGDQTVRILDDATGDELARIDLSKTLDRDHPTAIAFDPRDGASFDPPGVRLYVGTDRGAVVRFRTPLGSDR